MKMGKRRIVVEACLVLSVALATIAGGPAAHAQVVSRNHNAYGNSYGEWSARWVQWLLSIPGANNPAFDPTGGNCALGQSGPVWNLAGTFGGTATRACTIPAGRAVFFPILNGIFGAAVFDCHPTIPSVTCNLSALRAAATGSMDSVIISAELDGNSLNLSNQRVSSPDFSVTYPDGNVVGLHGGKAGRGVFGPNVADGYWVLLTPLSAGPHTLHFHGEITGGVFAGNVIDLTYNLTQL